MDKFTSSRRDGDFIFTPLSTDKSYVQCRDQSGEIYEVRKTYWIALPEIASENPHPVEDDIIRRLTDACVGHPYALIPWPHRLLHDAISEIEALRLEKANAPAAGDAASDPTP